MQNYIIRYVEDLKARIEPTGCSIATALAIELPAMEKARLFKLRDAADDLHRIIDLELMRRDEPVRTLTDEEIVCGVAQRLIAGGLPATPEHTGGGVWCVLIDDDEGGQWYWGMANETWGAQRNDVNGDCTDDLLETTVPSTSEDLDAIAAAIYAAQMAGPVLTIGVYVNPVTRPNTSRAELAGSFATQAEAEAFATTKRRALGTAFQVWCAPLAGGK